MAGNPLSAFALGRLEGGQVRLIGTAFFVRKNTLATAAHVLEGNDSNLIAIVPEHFNANLNGYQHQPRQGDLDYLSMSIADIDTVHDVALLQCAPGDGVDHPECPEFSGIDALNIGDEVFSVSYPHARLGNTTMIVQFARVGARALVRRGSIEIKHAVINQQTVLGQSGAPVYVDSNKSVAGILIGSYGLGTRSGISLGGIDPQTLHQNSFVVSAEYLKEMLS